MKRFAYEFERSEMLLLVMTFDAATGTYAGVGICPGCGESHTIPFKLREDLDAGKVVSSQCSTGPLMNRHVAVFVDPAKNAETRQAVASFVAWRGTKLVELRAEIKRIEDL